MGFAEKRKKIVNDSLKVLLIIFALSLATLRATSLLGPRGVICDTGWVISTGPCVWRNVSTEFIIWVVGVIILVLNLIFDHDFSDFLYTCKQNWSVFIFILLAFISIGWTIRMEITLYKAIVLLISSLFALYIGHTFRLKDILNILVLYYVFLSTFNLLFILLFPTLSIMSDPFFQGAWRGIFWHRNYLGSFMALGVVLFLVNILTNKKISGSDFYLNLVMLVLTTFLLIKSKNATGIITAFVLVGVVLVLSAWLKWRQKLKPVHYYGFFGVTSALFIFFLVNLDFFLGLLGRNSTLTGRVPMWRYLFENVISRRPWFGYGYGTIWHIQGFLEELQSATGWGVGMGDNGYIDILLHLGAIGLGILIILISLGFIRGVKYFLDKRTLEDAFPILVLVFVIVANITLSLILETETYVWMVSLATLVSISPRLTKLKEIKQV